MTDPIFDNLLEQADLAARNGEWPSAHDTLMKAADLQPDHSGVLTGIGTCLIQMAQIEKALGYFIKVAEIEPQSADALNNLGVAYILNNDPEPAEKAYKSAIALMPDYRPAWKNLAHIYLQKDSMVGEGVQILASLVQSDPTDTEALLLLGECYEIADDLESADVLYRKAIEVQPDLELARLALQRVAGKTRDSARIARPEHAQKLAALKNLRKKPD